MKKMTLSALMAAAACAPFAAHAADGTISFTGSVTAVSCTPAAGSSRDFTVALSPVAASSLTTVGSPAGTKEFTIAVTGCTSGAARAYFESTSPQVDSTTGNLKLLAGTAAAPAATNVQLAIYRGATKLDLSKGSASQDTTAGDVALTSDGATPAHYNGTLKYNVAYVATAAGVTAGSANSSVMYTIDNH